MSKKVDRSRRRLAPIVREASSVASRRTVRDEERLEGYGPGAIAGNAADEEANAVGGAGRGRQRLHDDVGDRGLGRRDAIGEGPLRMATSRAEVLESESLGVWIRLTRETESCVVFLK